MIFNIPDTDPDVTEAHRAGCAFLDTLYQKEIRERADIVIVSQGGAPKDLNLYQTQKALDNAKHRAASMILSRNPYPYPPLCSHSSTILGSVEPP